MQVQTSKVVDDKGNDVYTRTAGLLYNSYLKIKRDLPPITMENSKNGSWSVC